MKKLHVLFLTSWYPSRILKTNGDFIQRHAEAVSLLHKVSVIHVKTDRNLKEKIKVSDKKINGIRTIIAYIKPSKNPITKWLRFYNAYNLLLKTVDKFDVIHVNKFYPGGLFAYFYKKQKQIPYIITEHHTLYHQPYCEKIGFIEIFLSKIIVKNASYVCPVSDNLGNAMQKLGLKGTYHKIPNVVDTERFTFNKSTKNEVFTILHVSSMAKVKNIPGLLNVVKKLESKLEIFKFYIIGANAEDYIKVAKKLNINLNNVIFKNQVSHKKITTYFQKADVFVLFSDVENLPCVILESFSCGTPVISTNVGGISEFFPKNYGLLIQVKNETELVDSIVKIKENFNIETPEKMHQYVVNHFSEKQIANEFSTYYYKAINNE